MQPELLRGASRDIATGDHQVLCPEELPCRPKAADGIRDILNVIARNKLSDAVGYPDTPLQMAPWGMSEAGSKVKTEVVSIMRSLERDSGWPRILLEGMADKSLDLGAYKDLSTDEVQIMSQRDYERRLEGGVPPPNTSPPLLLTPASV